MFWYKKKAGIVLKGSGYGEADDVRKQYTGYERDDESGLDFAQARYYNPSHGRYTGVDPLTASANVKNPQTFNRYSYVLNSPYKFTDPLGLISEHTGACGNRCPGIDAWGGGLVSQYQGFENSGTESVGSTFQIGRQQQEQDGPYIAADGTIQGVSSNISTDISPRPLEPLPGAEPQSSITSIANENDALASVFTDGSGVARTNRSTGNPEFYNGGLTHFRTPEGVVWTIHVFGDIFGYTPGNVYVPRGFEATYIGEIKDRNTGEVINNAVVAVNKETGVYLFFNHIKGVSSQADLKRNLRTTNGAGSRLIGQSGGSGGNTPGYIHADIKIFSSKKGYDNYRMRDRGREFVPSRDLSDFRQFIQ